jgi:polyhydroxyalkanoate synthase
VLGYCLGGTLAAMHLAAHPDSAASLVALAAPVRFGDEGLLARWTRLRTFDVDALVNGFGNVPWQLMQGAFSLLRPTLNLSKAVHLLDKAWDDTFLDGFLALETWGNDNVSFPGEAYRRYIDELYRSDQLARGTFALSGRPARLQSIVCPTLAVTFEHDNIVPAASAKALLELCSATDRQNIHLPGGHVGAVVSRGASKTLWPQLSAYWAQRDGASSAGTRKVRPAAAARARGKRAP